MGVLAENRAESVQPSALLPQLVSFTCTDRRLQNYVLIFSVRVAITRRLKFLTESALIDVIITQRSTTTAPCYLSDRVNGNNDFTVAAQTQELEQQTLGRETAGTRSEISNRHIHQTS